MNYTYIVLHFFPQNVAIWKEEIMKQNQAAFMYIKKKSRSVLLGLAQDLLHPLSLFLYFILKSIMTRIRRFRVILKTLIGSASVVLVGLDSVCMCVWIGNFASWNQEVQ